MDLSRFKYDETSHSCLTRDGLPVGHLNGSGYYAFKIGKMKKVLAHRIIWQLFNGPIPDGSVLDHIDRNRLNNKISNLRLATSRQNAQNRIKKSKVGLIGVHYSKLHNNYEARVTVDGKKKTFGCFKSKYDAALQRDLVAYEHYGEHGVYNFPEFVKNYKKIKIENSENLEK